jgi:hypothetical protein
MSNLTSHFRMLTAAAVLLASIAGVSVHRAHAVAPSAAPCHEQAGDADSATACETICLSSSVSDLATSAPAVWHKATVMAASIAATVVPSHGTVSRHWRDVRSRPPQPHPLAINHRLLI